MRPRTLLALFGLVAGLLAFIWLYERDLPSSDERRQQAKKLWALEPEEVTGLVVERQDERVELIRAPAEEAGDEEESGSADGDEWRLVAPLEARADDDLVDDLLSTLSSLEKKRTLEDVEASEVGLEEPRARLTVITGNGRRELLIGAEIPASSSMVVALDDGGRVFVVDDGLWENLDREPGDWRSREVFSGRSDEIERLTLISDEERVLLARRGKDFWIEAPLVDRADDDKVSNLLFELTGLEIERFIDEPAQPLSEMGLDPAAGVVEVVVRDREEPFRLELGSAVSEDPVRRYARVANQVFELESDIGDAVERPLEEWRSLSWTSLESYQIDTLRVTEGQSEMVLERSGATWKRGEEEISFAPVSDFLYAVTGATGERLLREEEAAELDLEPQLVLALAGDEKQEELRLYPPTLGGYPARSSGREAVLLLSQEEVDELRDKLGEVRSAEPTAPAESSPPESSEGDDP